MKWVVKYLLAYKDKNRQGETACNDRKEAVQWVEAAKANPDFLEVSIWHGPREIGDWKRDERGKLRRVWTQA